MRLRNNNKFLKDNKINRNELLNLYLQGIEELEENWEFGIEVINDCDNYQEDFFNLDDEDISYILNYLDDYLEFKNVQKDILSQI